MICLKWPYHQKTRRQAVPPREPTTNETRGLQNFFLLLLLTPQISERVNDDPEDQIQDDDDDHEEEEQVVNDASGKQRLLQRGKKVSGNHFIVGGITVMWGIT